jgi:20S proteasome subunit alpha 4
MFLLHTTHTLTHTSIYYPTHRLQEARTIRKIVSIDDRSVLAFAGLTADARVLISKIRMEAQSYRLTMEDAPSIDYLARYLARIQQQYTQRGGVRPFGIASLFCGVNDANDGIPELYQTDPAGTHSRWKAQVIGGRNSKSLREFLEKNYSEEMEEAQCTRLAIQALLEVVDSGAKTMEICVVRKGGVKEMITEEAIEGIVKEIEQDQEEKRAPAAASGDE